MGHLWDIAQAHMDEYGVRAAALARRMGTSPQTLDSWKNRGVRNLPTRELLEALARETRTPYPAVLEAALRDINYLPKELDRDRDPTPSTRAGGSPAVEPFATHRDEVTLAARRGVPGNPPDTSTGEESQDAGHDDPA